MALVQQNGAFTFIQHRFPSADGFFHVLQVGLYFPEHYWWDVLRRPQLFTPPARYHYQNSFGDETILLRF